MGFPRDAKLLSRMQAIGSFEVLKRSFLDRLAKISRVVVWDSPSGLDNDLAHLRLRMAFDDSAGSNDEGLRRLLDEWDSLQGRFSELVPELKSYLVDFFRGCYEAELPPRQRAEYLGPDLQISEKAILSHVNEGEIGLGLEFGKIRRMVWFNVDWDAEHGVDIIFDASGQITRPWMEKP